MADKELFRACNFLAVTPSDTVNISPTPCTGLYIGGAGNVTCLNASGAPILFTAVPVGTILPIATTRVNSTGTGASAIIALF